MLSHQPFYWSHIRKYIVLMGTLLNDISLERESNGKKKTIKVPVSFSQKDKQLQRIISNPELRNSWRNYLPRIGFEMGSPMYSPERKDNTNNYYQVDSSGRKRRMQFPAAPYDIPFTVYVWVPYYEDGLQIVEQILPFFQPEYVVKVEELPGLDLKRDISVSLLSVSQNDMYDGDFEDMRLIEWQIEFNLKGWFYGPMNENTVIKKAMVDYIFNIDENLIEDVPTMKYSASVNPFEADKNQPHTIDEVIENE